MAQFVATHPPLTAPVVDREITRLFVKKSLPGERQVSYIPLLSPRRVRGRVLWLSFRCCLCFSLELSLPLSSLFLLTLGFPLSMSRSLVCSCHLSLASESVCVPALASVAVSACVSVHGYLLPRLATPTYPILSSTGTYGAACPRRQAPTPCSAGTSIRARCAPRYVCCGVPASSR